MRMLMSIVFAGLLNGSYAQSAPCVASPESVKRFYQLVNLPHPWIQEPALLQQLAQVLQQATAYGLPEQVYPLACLDSLGRELLSLNSGQDSLAADARITVVALCYFRALANGTGTSPVDYEGVHPSVACIDITALLATSVNQLQVAQLPAIVEPTTNLYKSLRDSLQSIQKVLTDSSAATGSIRPTLIMRINALCQAINAARWLRCQLEEQCILVNIPSATLQYYVEGKLLLSSKVIVGKPSTPTGTLSSEVLEIILYPYWTVPGKIARRELLPLIKRNPGYLQTNGYQVLNNGRLIDPSSIDWKKYSSSYFPFTLRQSTGCDNSMGIIKLNFYSPYGLFLHDTPWKILFNAPNRYFSHGCVRVERVAELARLLLKDDSVTLNAILQKGDSLNTQPTPIGMNTPIPVVIVYETAWPDISGAVRFFEDIYRSRKGTAPKKP